MLGKLLKYEIPAMGRKLLPLYAAWAVTAVILGVTAQAAGSKSEFAVAISGLLYAGVAIAIFVMAIVLIVQRYSGSLLGDEAYFNHVLPVSVSAHIGNKLISAFIWIVITVLVALLTGVLIMLAAMIVSGFDFSIFNSDVSYIGLPDHFWLYVIEFLIIVIAGTVKTIMQIYAAITIGHQVADHTTLASIGAYILVLLFESFAGRLMIALFGLKKLTYQADGFVNFTQVFVPAVIAAAAFSAIYFFICKYLMEKRLNLA